MSLGTEFESIELGIPLQFGLKVQGAVQTIELKNALGMVSAERPPAAEEGAAQGKLEMMPATVSTEAFSDVEEGAEHGTEMSSMGIAVTPPPCFADEKEKRSEGSIIGCAALRNACGFNNAGSSRLPSLECLRVFCSLLVCVHHLDLLYPVQTCTSWGAGCEYACAAVGVGCDVAGRRLAAGEEESVTVPFVDVYNGHWAVSVFYILAAFVASLSLQSVNSGNGKAWTRVGRSLVLRFPRLAVPAMGANLFVVLLIRSSSWTSVQSPKWHKWWDDLTMFRNWPIVLLGDTRLVGPVWCLIRFYRIPFLAILVCATVQSENRHWLAVRLFMFGVFGWVARSVVVPFMDHEEVVCTILGIAIMTVYTSSATDKLTAMVFQIAITLVPFPLSLLPCFYNNAMLKMFAGGGAVMGVLLSERWLAGMEIGTSWWSRRMNTVRIKATKIVVAMAPYTMTVFLWHTIVWTFCHHHIMPRFFGTPVWALYVVVPWLILAAVTFVVYHFWEAPLLFSVSLMYDKLMVVQPPNFTCNVCERFSGTPWR